ncbi:MAG: N-acyl-D-amino-acid deacylase family protein [Minisyncoccia bacterium]
MYDILIKNGEIIDGTGLALKKADLAIKNGKIVALGNFKNERAKTEINADKKYISPGFIDINNDSDHDLSLLEMPEADNLIRQGITTIVGGNCGASLAPLISHSLVSLDKWIKVSNLNISWRTLAEFLKFLEQKHLAVNFATLVGWGTLREDLTQNQFRPLTQKELEELQFLVQMSLEQGAFGVSFGLGYNLEQAVGLTEFQALAKLVKKKNAFLSFHLRNEADGFLASIREVLEVAEKEKVSLEISHLRVEGKDNFDIFPEALKMINNVNQESELVNFDVFPYDYNVESIYLLLPEWVAVGGREVLLKNLHNEVVRKKIIEDLKRKKCLYQDLIVVDSGERWWFVGKSLKEISQGFNLSLEESLLKIIELCEKRVSVLIKNLSLDNVQKAIMSPYSLIASNGTVSNLDGGEKGKWIHPRVFSTFPKFLNDYVKEQKLFTWEEAINKITGKVADKLGLKNRGYLKENYAADIVIFNPEKIKDKSTLENPFQYPEGIETVIVNGQVAYQKGLFSHERFGQVLRKM